MLDVKFIRENLELVEKSTKEKGYKIDIGEVLKLDDERKAILSEAEKLRARRNEIAGQMKGGKPSEELIAEGKKIVFQNVGKVDENVFGLGIPEDLMKFEENQVSRTVFQS